MTTRVADLELALDYALGVLVKFEPPDSRAVSNEFVAMAAIRCEQDRLEECREILRAAIAIEAAQAGETQSGSTGTAKARAVGIARKDAVNTAQASETSK